MLVIPHVQNLIVRISKEMIGVEECTQLLTEICVNHYNSNDRNEKLLEQYGDLKEVVKSS